MEFIFKNHWSTLQSLIINGSQLTDDSFNYLSNCINLKTFSIKRGSTLTSEFLAQIKKLKSLVSLSFVKLRNMCLLISDLGTNLKQLKHLSFEGCRINDEILINLPIW
jgi:hypothetical protein